MHVGGKNMCDWLRSRACLSTGDCQSGVQTFLNCRCDFYFVHKGAVYVSPRWARPTEMYVPPVNNKALILYFHNMAVIDWNNIRLDCVVSSPDSQSGGNALRASLSVWLVQLVETRACLSLQRIVVRLPCRQLDIDCHLFGAGEMWNNH